MVEAAPSAYLRSHLVHAIHRVAMQTDVLELAATRGIGDLRLSDLDRTRDYDKLNRDTKESYPGTKVNDYNYDKVGNLTV